MDNMTNEQFIEQIERWQLLLSQTNITLSNGEPLPNKFFHVFLGVGYSTFKKMVSGKDSIREIQPYTSKTIRFINKLDPTVLLEEIRIAVIEYEKVYIPKN
jgi:hypothetical protein